MPKRTKFTIKKIASIVIVSGILLYIAFGFLVNLQFKRSFKMTTGEITDVTGTWKNGKNRAFIYEFKLTKEKVKGTTYYEDCGRLTGAKVRSLVLGKSFPVAYSTKKLIITSSTIILTFEKAKMFNYKMPDSLLHYDSVLTCKY